MANIRLLAIDGGGIRGIIPAMILKEIEQQTGQPIAQLFHLISGTSTGGIIASGLSAQNPHSQRYYSASDILNLYINHGDTMFNSGSWFRSSFLGLINLFNARFHANNLELLFNDYFGDQLLSSVRNHDILITSYDIERRRPKFFKSWRACNKPYDLSPERTLIAEAENFFLKDIARATSAAPTYFSPIHTQCQTGINYALVDGGVFANNPAMCAVSSAIRIYNVRRLDNLSVLSLGTGHSLSALPYKKARNWGIIEWAQPILGVLIDGVSTSVDYQITSVLGGQHYRFDVDLQECRRLTNSKFPSDSMDNASKENIEALMFATQSLLKNNSDFLRYIQKLVDEPLTPRDELLARHDMRLKDDQWLASVNTDSNKEALDTPLAG